MKVLIINNGTKFLDDLLRLLKKHKVRIIDSKNLNFFSTKGFDKIILTGGSRFSVRNHLSKYKKEIALVRQSKIPVLGICLGFEIICAAYDEKLERKLFREKGIKKIKIPKESQQELLKGVTSLNVYENHRWKVKYTHFLKPLIISKEQIEMVKHPKKDIYGTQFHPEFRETKMANKIIKNFLKS